MTSQHSTGPQLHLNNTFIIQMLSLLTGAVGLPWGSGDSAASWASLSLVSVAAQLQVPLKWLPPAAHRGQEQFTTDSPRLPVVRLNGFWLYNGAKAISIQWKPYFKVWILIFPWASDIQCHTVSWCWVASASHGSQATMRWWGQGTNTVQCTVLPAFYRYCVLFLCIPSCL